MKLSIIMKVLLRGIGAGKGTSKGKVRVILKPKDMEKMKRNEILVTEMTNPLFTPAIQKSAAIVTDVGGKLCHAAIVSRELGIPCVVNTEKATKILKDGMEVIVDGEEGVVYEV
ncbi:MAG: hypothetical protein JSV92_01335 [archaeon]|nr:MAG: hypothetical protein JSV92_01335 [archaeon]